MTVSSVVHLIVADAMFKAVVVLIVLDLILGVAAAVKNGQFAFAKVTGFLRDDVLGKVVPWAALYAGWKFAPSVDLLGVGLEEITRGAGALMIAALAGSLTSSLADLGLASKAPAALTKGENT